MVESQAGEGATWGCALLQTAKFANRKGSTHIYIIRASDALRGQNWVLQYKAEVMFAAPSAGGFEIHFGVDVFSGECQLAGCDE